MKPRKIVIGSDHAGFDQKKRAARELEALGVEVEDKGTFSDESVDYPDYGAAVGRAVASGEADRGVLICGSGIGVAMAANKIHGVRAAVCWNEETARLARAQRRERLMHRRPVHRTWPRGPHHPRLPRDGLRRGQARAARGKVEGVGRKLRTHVGRERR